MLGMYVHAHWGYNRPYAARSWRIEEWENYLSGLDHLGYIVRYAGVRSAGQSPHEP